MNLSVMSVAMHLSGLEAEHFTNNSVKVKWLYEDGARILQTASPALSTTSSTSSSGFNSWGSDIPNMKEDALHPNQIPIQILKQVAVKNSNNVSIQPTKKISYNGRNILDLGSNLTNSKWDLSYSVLPKDVHSFFNNRSQYSRVNGDKPPLHVEVPCDQCEFIQSYFD